MVFSILPETRAANCLQQQQQTEEARQPASLPRDSRIPELQLSGMAGSPEDTAAPLWKLAEESGKHS